MLAARDQENVIHARQTSAAAKPLNQGVRVLQPKTPGIVKTPFRAVKNDENKPVELKGQKTVLRDGLGKMDKNKAFITPLGPRSRAPLGLKTTNAKARALKTPGPGQQQPDRAERTAKKLSTTRRSARSKITIAPSEPVQTDLLARPDEDDEADFGYAPPAPTDLPDPPIEFPYDQIFPQFQGENMFRGYGEIYLTSPKDEHGISLRLKREQEEYSQIQREEEERYFDRITESLRPGQLDPNKQVEAMLAAGPKKPRIEESKVNTFKAKSAAQALSQPHFRLPSAVTKQTTASEQKKRGAVAARGVKSVSRLGEAPSTRSGHAAISKNTIGFPKAKKAPSIVPRGEKKETMEGRSQPIKIDQSKMHPKVFRELYGSPPAESEMWFRLRECEESSDRNDDTDDDAAHELFDTDFFPFEQENDDGDGVFQLPMPE